MILSEAYNRLRKKETKNKLGITEEDVISIRSGLLKIMEDRKKVRIYGLTPEDYERQLDEAKKKEQKITWELRVLKEEYKKRLERMVKAAEKLLNGFIKEKEGVIEHYKEYIKAYEELDLTELVTQLREIIYKEEQQLNRLLSLKRGLLQECKKRLSELQK